MQGFPKLRMVCAARREKIAMTKHPVLSTGLVSSVVGMLFGAVAASAIAAPPPNYAVRLTADFHLQLEISDTILPDAFPGQCRVSGTVVRLFRDRTDTLSEGQVIQFETPCAIISPESGPSDLSDADEFANAAYLEVFLNPGLDEAYALASHQYMVIKGATEDPLCETDRAGIKC